MHKKSLSFFKLFIFLFVYQTVLGKGHSIAIDFKNDPGKKVYLGAYYFGNILLKDSVLLDASGRATFTNNEKLQEGIYQLYFDQNRHFDFLLGEDQTLSISGSGTKIKVNTDGAWETEKFNQYLAFLKEKKAEQKRYMELEKKYKHQDDSIMKYNKLLLHLNTQLKNFWRQETKKYPDTFYGKFIGSNYTPTVLIEQIPEYYLQNDSTRWMYEYYFQKKHFWDYYHLNDTRMWHTPTVKNRLSDYFNKVLIQHPDSVLSAAIELIEEFRGNPLAFQNLVSFILNNSIQSSIMGIENVFVAIAEKYYLSGQATWVSEQTLNTIRLEVFYRKNNLLGLKSPELVLEDINEQYQSLHQLTTPYTLLVFWEPSCGHCKTELPKLYKELFLKADPSWLAVYAVYTQRDKVSWEGFLTEHQLNDWINVWDPGQTSNFQVLYNVRSTPAIYLLDEDKKIIAKNMNIENARIILKSKKVPFHNE